MSMQVVFKMEAFGSPQPITVEVMESIIRSLSVETDAKF